MKKLAILSSLLLLALNSCSNEDIINEELPNNFEKRITVVAEDLTPAESTRTSYTEKADGKGYSFSWSEGDALGIFPENGYQTAFPIGTDGVGSNTAVFDGGKWALRPNESYAAYYPLVDKLSLDSDAIPVDYTGQTQIGNNSTAHLSKYDFMASSFNDVDDKGNVNFQLQHLGCLVQFKLTMPELDTYTSLEITSDKVPFITSGTYSLADVDHDFANVQTSPKITIGLSNVSTTAGNKDITITAMFAPVDLSGNKLTLTVKGSNKDYSFVVDGQNLQNVMAVDGTRDTTPYVTFHAEAEQTLTMSRAVETLEYSVNNSSWATLGTNTVTFGGSYGDLRIRGKSSIGTATSLEEYSTIRFGNTTKVSCKGDIRTLIDYETYNTVNTRNARFCSLFRGCSSLETAPELLATSLADHCYSEMFIYCGSLTQAPAKLPANSLADYCYMRMFLGCTSLTQAPELPADSLADCCYWCMFYGCTSLKQAPELPATSLANHCYYCMFNGCTSLSQAPTKLPANSLADYCYSNMFYDCTSLMTAPELPATTLAERCYSEMFYGCTSLSQAPTKLPANSLADCCYFCMFSGCTSLTQAPELPATSLAPSCYSQMFYGCTSLAQAPELPATTLAPFCYSYMFYGCTSLSYVKVLATDFSDANCLNLWLYNVAQTGTFVKSKDATLNITGPSGVPFGWIVENVGE